MESYIKNMVSQESISLQVVVEGTISEEDMTTIYVSSFSTVFISNFLFTSKCKNAATVYFLDMTLLMWASSMPFDSFKSD